MSSFRLGYCDLLSFQLTNDGFTESRQKPGYHVGLGRFFCLSFGPTIPE